MTNRRRRTDVSMVNRLAPCHLWAVVGHAGAKVDYAHTRVQQDCPALRRPRRPIFYSLFFSEAFPDPPLESE